MRPAGAGPLGRILELHVNHNDTALRVLRRRKRLAPILVLGVLEGKLHALTAAVLLAASNLFDDPGIQHRITSNLVLRWL